MDFRMHYYKLFDSCKKLQLLHLGAFISMLILHISLYDMNR